MSKKKNKEKVNGEEMLNDFLEKNTNKKKEKGEDKIIKRAKFDLSFTEDEDFSDKHEYDLEYPDTYHIATENENNQEHLFEPINRTMDLSMLNRPDAKNFLEAFSGVFKAFMGSYGLRWHIDGSEHPQRRYWEYWWLLSHTPIKPGDIVLDAGAGVAPFSFFITNTTESSVSIYTIDDKSQSLDFPSFNIRAANALGIKSRYSTNVGNIVNMKKQFEDKTFNVIFCVSVIEHIKKDEDVIIELARVTAPGGYISLSFDFHKEEFPSRKDRLYTIKDINRIREVAKHAGLYVRGNTEYVDETDWRNPPINLGPSPDHKYTFGTLFFKKID